MLEWNCKIFFFINWFSWLRWWVVWWWRFILIVLVWVVMNGVFWWFWLKRVRCRLVIWCFIFCWIRCRLVVCWCVWNRMVWYCVSLVWMMFVCVLLSLWFKGVSCIVRLCWWWKSVKFIFCKFWAVVNVRFWCGLWKRFGNVFCVWWMMLIEVCWCLVDVILWGFLIMWCRWMVYFVILRRLLWISLLILISMMLNVMRISYDVLRKGLCRFILRKSLKVMKVCLVDSCYWMFWLVFSVWDGVVCWWRKVWMLLMMSGKSRSWSKVLFFWLGWLG